MKIFCVARNEYDHGSHRFTGPTQSCLTHHASQSVPESVIRWTELSNQGQQGVPGRGLVRAGITDYLPTDDRIIVRIGKQVHKVSNYLLGERNGREQNSGRQRSVSMDKTYDRWSRQTKQRKTCLQTEGQATLES